MIGCHSTMDKPECVRRVTPPTTTIAKTSAQQRKSQAATRRSAEVRWLPVLMLLRVCGVEASDCTQVFCHSGMDRSFETLARGAWSVASQLAALDNRTKCQ